MKQYTVTGMSCAACSARVEKAVSKVDGVTSCSVSLLTNSMGVEGSATDAQIVEAVEQSGYGASPKGTATESDNDKANNSLEQLKAAQDALVDRETPKLRNRLIASLIFLVVLMYFSMGHMMWGWPLPEFFNGNHVAMGLLQLLLTVAVMVINQKFFISGFKGLIHGAPNMDTLVALGSAASFGYSVYALFAMTAAQVNGDMDAVMSYMHEFYFESAAMILALITVGKMLEAHSKGKTTDALKSLMQLAPKTATVVRDGVEQEISVDAVKKGDIFVTVTGCKDVIRKEHMEVMKDGVLLANAGHFDVEINKNDLAALSVQAPYEARQNITAYTLANGHRLNLLGEGRLVNLACGDGHPTEIMDLSFAMQFLAMRYLLEQKGKLDKKLYVLPKELDHEVALLKLRAMGFDIDTLTAEQEAYLHQA